MSMSILYCMNYTRKIRCSCFSKSNGWKEFQIAAFLGRHFQRLWDMQFSDGQEFPLTSEMVLEAKARGLCKHTAHTVLARELVTFDHRPVLQSVMDSATTSYETPCWVMGCCQKKEWLCRNSKLFHRSMMQSMKKQLQSRLPKAIAKDFLRSGDVVIAIHFPGQSPAPAASSSSSSSSSSHCHPSSSDGKGSRFFLVPKVVLKPEYAILMELDFNAKNNTASLQAHPESGIFSITRSIDLAVELLSETRPPTSLWLSVLHHNPVLLVCGMVTVDYGCMDALG